MTPYPSAGKRGPGDRAAPSGAGAPGGRLARFASGRTTKWLILGFWLFVLALSPAGKLTGAEKNDASLWLPGNAESTAGAGTPVPAFSSPRHDPGRHRLRAPERG